jgi:hypothetical protein
MLLQKDNYLNCFIQSKEPGLIGQPEVRAVRPAAVAPKRELYFATILRKREREMLKRKKKKNEQKTERGSKKESKRG